MNTDALSLFAALYQERSIARAAARTFLTPQGANRALKALESELGATLFERTSAGLRPTEAGERFNAFAEQGLRELAWLREDIGRLSAQTKPTVRVGMEPDLLSAVGMEAFESFSAARPDVALEMHEMPDHELAERLASGGIDCGFAVLPLADERFETFALASERTYVLTRAGLFCAGRPAVGVADLRGVPLVVVDRSFKARRAFDDHCREAGFEPSVLFASNDKSLTYSAVRSGRACTVIAEHELRQLDLAGLDAVELAGDRWAYGLALARGKALPAHVEAFVSHMRDAQAAR